ncbi:MAG: L-histidine N(alpha)-methyltransferase [Leptospirales bacterium]|nr:L-histidine N(alpha)-methyltransferase [Leptospirales bacterium]
MKTAGLERDELGRILRGLRGSPRELFPALLYDRQGSNLYEEICATPEYYPTRSELEILDIHGESIAQLVGKGALLIEPGCGAATKSAILLESLHDAAGYIGIDVSASMLAEACQGLRERFPGLPVHDLSYDFSESFNIELPPIAAERRLFYYAGSSIGNFHPEEAVDFLGNLASCADSGDLLLIGVDLLKDPALLHAAYNDRAGATARFHKNVLDRLVRDYGATLQCSCFDHYAFFHPAQSRIEMHLVANRKTTIELEDERFDFQAGESLISEYSYKYTTASFSELAARAGWNLRQSWTDSKARFANLLFALGDGD